MKILCHLGTTSKMRSRKLFMSACSLFSFCNLTVPFIEAQCSALFIAVLHPINSFFSFSPFASIQIASRKDEEIFFRRLSIQGIYLPFCFDLLSCCFTVLQKFFLSSFLSPRLVQGVQGDSMNVCGSERVEVRRSDRSADVYLYFFSFYYLLARSDDTFSPHSNQFQVVYSRLSTFSFCAPLLFSILSDGITLRLIQIVINYFVIDCI